MRLRPTQIIGTLSPKAVITEPINIMRLSISTSFLLPKRKASVLLVTSKMKQPNMADVPGKVPLNLWYIYITLTVNGTLFFFFFTNPCYFVSVNFKIEEGPLLSVIQPWYHDIVGTVWSTPTEHNDVNKNCGQTLERYGQINNSSVPEKSPSCSRLVGSFHGPTCLQRLLENFILRSKTFYSQSQVGSKLKPYVRWLWLPHFFSTAISKNQQT